MNFEPLTIDAATWPLATIDFEASALSPESYPIEVGVCVWRAPDQPIEGWSTLIRPMRHWIEHGDWDGRSAAIHNIPKEALDDGVSPTHAVAALNQILGSIPVAWCDGRAADRHWADRLSGASIVEPTYAIHELDLLIDGLDQLAVLRMHRWLQRAPPRHRARDDAERLMKAVARGLRLRHGSPVDLIVAGSNTEDL